MKPRYCRSVNGKGAGRPRLSHHHKGWWNETKWMRWVWRNGGTKFVVGENGRNPAKNLPRPRFVHHETHMEWPRRELGTPAVRGERLTACATRPPLYFIDIPVNYFFYIQTFFSFFFLYLSIVYPSPMQDLQPIHYGSDVYRGSQRLWTRTLHRYTMTDLPESMDIETIAFYLIDMRYLNYLLITL